MNAEQQWKRNSACTSIHGSDTVLCVLGHAGVFVHSIATGAGEYQDVWSSFYGNVNQQVRCCKATRLQLVQTVYCSKACAKLHAATFQYHTHLHALRHQAS
jgi:hypothetical protein